MYRNKANPSGEYDTNPARIPAKADAQVTTVTKTATIMRPSEVGILD